MPASFKSFFRENRTYYKGSAPGRLDVMGGVADYSGSLLLQMPIKERTTVTLAQRDDSIIRVYSQTAAEAGFPSEVIYSLPELQKVHDYDSFRQQVLTLPGGDWALYVLGCFYLIAKEKQITLKGADVYVQSDVPFGKGVSSSAAIEVATLMALNQAYNLGLKELELPVLAQKVENCIVGAPCGLMDQLASYLGQENKLLPIICQPVEVLPPIAIPDKVTFIGIDSGVKHAVSGHAYKNARIGAFMGYSIIAASLGYTKATLKEARDTNTWHTLPYRGYLANIPVSDFKDKYLELLPLTISGREFIQQFGATIDAVTEIDQSEIYKVRYCTMHPVYENERVTLFKNYLQNLAQKPANPEDILQKAGQLMYQSHESYSACGLGNEQTDEIVNMVRETGPEGGLFGAKITGGGSGGTVCVLAYGTKGMESTKQVFKQYSEKYNQKLTLFQGSSPGGLYYRF